MSKTIDFFDRKKVKEEVISIPEAGEYDLTNFDNDLSACGISDMESFAKRHEDLFTTGFVVDSSRENPVGTVCKRIEAAFSKREIAFLLSKDLLLASYKESIKTNKTEE